MSRQLQDGVAGVTILVSSGAPNSDPGMGQGAKEDIPEQADLCENRRRCRESRAGGTPVKAQGLPGSVNVSG